MSNQYGYPHGFPSYGAPNPYSSRTQYSSIHPVPQDLVDAISAVTVDHLANLSLDSHQGFMICVSLGGNITGSLLNWFDEVYYPPDPSQDTMQRRRHELMTYRDMTWPIYGSVDEDHRRASQNPRYRAQSFLRRLIEELGLQDADLARSFVTGLGLPSLPPPPSPPPPPPPPLPLPSPSPSSSPPAAAPAGGHIPLLPHIPPLSFQTQSPTQTTSTSTSLSKSYYCPECGNHFSRFNNMDRHWFEEHYRSTRRSQYLKNLCKRGALGPFTADEAKARGIDKDGIAEPEAAKIKRRAMKKEAKKWRHRMQQDPAGWEGVAQQEDGYTDMIAGIVNYQRMKRAQTRQRAEEEKNKKDRKDEGGGDEE